MPTAAGSSASAASPAGMAPASPRAASQQTHTAAASHAGASAASASVRLDSRARSMPVSRCPSRVAAARDRGRVMFTSSHGIFSAAMV